MTGRSVFNLGAVVEIGFVHRDSTGSLATPTDATAHIVTPSGIRFTDLDGDDRAVIDLGLPAGNTQSITTTSAARLGITLEQNQIGTGLGRVRFIGSEPGRWTGSITLTGPDGARDAVDFELVVDAPATGRAYTGTLVVG